MKKKWTIQILCMLSILLMFSSCYHRRAHHQMHAAMVEYSNKQLDSISFSTTHHYTNKFNFLVFKDSLELIAQQPEEFLSNLPIDSFAVRKNRLLVVTDIRMVPQDSIDSVWVQLATEDNQFGWIFQIRYQLVILVPTFFRGFIPLAIVVAQINLQLIPALALEN